MLILPHKPALIPGRWPMFDRGRPTYCVFCGRPRQCNPCCPEGVASSSSSIIYGCGCPEAKRRYTVNVAGTTCTAPYTMNRNWSLCGVTGDPAGTCVWRQDVGTVGQRRRCQLLLDGPSVAKLEFLAEVFGSFVLEARYEANCADFAQNGCTTFSLTVDTGSLCSGWPATLSLCMSATPCP